MYTNRFFFAFKFRPIFKFLFFVNKNSCYQFKKRRLNWIKNTFAVRTVQTKNTIFSAKGGSNERINGWTRPDDFQNRVKWISRKCFCLCWTAGCFSCSKAKCFNWKIFVLILSFLTRSSFNLSIRFLWFICAKRPAWTAPQKNSFLFFGD